MNDICRICGRVTDDYTPSARASHGACRGCYSEYVRLHRADGAAARALTALRQRLRAERAPENVRRAWRTRWGHSRAFVANEPVAALLATIPPSFRDDGPAALRIVRRDPSRPFLPSNARVEVCWRRGHAPPRAARDAQRRHLERESRGEDDSRSG